MRGKDKGSEVYLCKIRITPACAGKRCSVGGHFVLIRDHPRVCGEKSSCLLYRPCGRGSPPRVRGKANGIIQNLPALGIPPACAGKRVRRRASQRAARDHPRVCGEKDPDSGSKASHVGSPPRVRGKVSHGTCCRFDFGITPACAGKRRALRELGVGCEDHPRVCGEKCFLMAV